MAETLISPGVLSRENDQSQITAQPIQAGAALIGPTVLGKPGIPTLVTTYSEYLATFGSTFLSGSDDYSFLTSDAAFNYFQNAGTSLLVTRVTSGSFSPASSSAVASQTGSLPNAFTLETLGEGIVMNNTLPTESVGGVLPSGSSNNIRWEISSPNLSRGVFSLIIRQGNDTTNSKSVLESFTNVSLDPKASNYIARVVGDTTTNILGGDTTPYLQESGSFPNASRYVRVKSVTLKTPNYFDNNGVANNAYTSSIPIAQSGSFGGAAGDIVKAGQNFNENINNTDTQGLVGLNYTQTINLLANKDDYQYNIISTPGLIYANATHKTQLDTLISNTENRGDAPAGINRGGLGTVRQAERKLTQANRDSLYINKVNPIASFPGKGIVVFGQKTLQTQASALDRVNVRRLLITLKGYISQISDNLVFEQNSAATRNTFLSQVNPYLESVQQRQGLYSFKVVMDSTNNTADVIDRNQLIGAIYLQPTKTAEYIYLDFNILPTGATFPS